MSVRGLRVKLPSRSLLCPSENPCVFPSLPLPSTISFSIMRHLPCTTPCRGRHLPHDSFCVNSRKYMHRFQSCMSSQRGPPSPPEPHLWALQRSGSHSQSCVSAQVLREDIPLMARQSAQALSSPAPHTSTDVKYHLLRLVPRGTSRGPSF